MFEVLITAACPESEAGSPFTLRFTDEAGGAVSLESNVAATRSWDEHRSRSVGTVELVAGDHLVVVESGRASGPLMKLRHVELVPIVD